MLFPQESTLPVKLVHVNLLQQGACKLCQGQLEKDLIFLKIARGFFSFGLGVCLVCFIFVFPFSPVVCHPEGDAGSRPSHAEHWLLLPAAGMLSSRRASGARYWQRAAGQQLLLRPLPPCPAADCCQGGWRGPAEGPHHRQEKHFHANWPKGALGVPCTHTFPSSTAAAGSPRGRMPAGRCLPQRGMPIAPVLGTSILQGSSMALRRFPLGDLGVPARAGASLSLCGTLCGRAPSNPRPSPRATPGSGGQSVPVPTAGPPQHRWARSSLRWLRGCSRERKWGLVMSATFCAVSWFMFRGAFWKKLCARVSCGLVMSVWVSVLCVLWKPVGSSWEGFLAKMFWFFISSFYRLCIPLSCAKKCSVYPPV